MTKPGPNCSLLLWNLPIQDWLEEDGRQEMLGCCRKVAVNCTYQDTQGGRCAGGRWGAVWRLSSCSFPAQSICIALWGTPHRMQDYDTKQGKCGFCLHLVGETSVKPTAIQIWFQIVIHVRKEK